MTDTTQTIDVDVPIGTAYNQWTQFESFPEFMDGVDEVTQKTDTLTHWKISIGGVKREFDAEITEQHPDERVAWRAVDGTDHAGVVTFHKIAPDKTRIALQIETNPKGLVEKAGDALGLTNANAKADLKRFKQFIEKRGTETGAWRGDVPRS
ncbi:MAG: SRPBCC family protein [Frankiaceae bacterium]|nr:SRPBCC family protein [Frankiaceae bacterium]MBV9368830.1 SRPBCC family protein [Frankiales bacterium]